MKVLEKKQDIQKLKNEERKREIDDGIALATRIDKLRETKANEEQALFTWRETALREIQKEIDDYITVRDNLQVQTEAAEVHRKKLIEPLDTEWKELNKEKEDIEKDRKIISIIQTQLEIDRNEVKKQWDAVSETVTRTNQKEVQIDKAKSAAVSLKELAQKEYEIARIEREEHLNEHEKEMKSVRELKKQYKVALSTIGIREHQVQDKESELITRERDLERRLNRLKTQEQTNDTN
jgi:hypothetical protein